MKPSDFKVMLTERRKSLLFQKYATRLKFHGMQWNQRQLLSYLRKVALSLPLMKLFIVEDIEDITRRGFIQISTLISGLWGWNNCKITIHFRELQLMYYIFQNWIHKHFSFHHKSYTVYSHELLLSSTSCYKFTGNFVEKFWYKKACCSIQFYCLFPFEPFSSVSAR